jgi:hypothetical protein
MTAAAQVGQRGAVALGGVTDGFKREMQDTPRGFKRRKRTRVHFAEYRRAQRMRIEFPAVLDRNVPCHCFRVACEWAFGKMDRRLAQKLLKL